MPDKLTYQEQEYGLKLRLRKDRRNVDGAIGARWMVRWLRQQGLVPCRIHEEVQFDMADLATRVLIVSATALSGVPPELRDGVEAAIKQQRFTKIGHGHRICLTPS